MYDQSDHKIIPKISVFLSTSVSGFVDLREIIILEVVCIRLESSISRTDRVGWNLKSPVSQASRSQ